MSSSPLEPVKSKPTEHRELTSSAPYTFHAAKVTFTLRKEVVCEKSRYQAVDVKRRRRRRSPKKRDPPTISSSAEKGQKLRKTQTLSPWTKNG
jgi:hypothetical protein